MELKQEAERGSRKGEAAHAEPEGREKVARAVAGVSSVHLGKREARLAESVRKQVVAQDETRKVGRGAARGLKTWKPLRVYSEAGGKCFGLWEFLSGQMTGFCHKGYLVAECRQDCTGCD